jgi:hypothetical protein
MSMIGRYPGLTSGLAWAAITLVIVLLCSNSESRIALLGKGKVLSAASLVSLFLILALTLVGWSLAS